MDQGVDVLIETELYDSEILTIQKVVQSIPTNVSASLAGWAKMVEGKFTDAGFRVVVNIYELPGQTHLASSERTYKPEVVVQGRVEDIKVGEYDHDRQRHEVRANILGKTPDGDSSKKTQVQSGFSATKSGLYVPKAN